jgi:protein disulfide-isomerase A1
VTHNSQAITTFVKAAGTRLVVESLPELHASYVAVGLDKHDPVVSTPNYDVYAGIPLGYVFAETVEVRALLSETVEPLAKKFKGRTQFGTVDVKIFD